MGPPPVEPPTIDSNLSGEAYVASAITEARRKPPFPNYFVRHWRGGLSLPVAYWLNGFLGNIAVLLIVGVFMGVMSTEFERSLRFSFVALIAFAVITAGG